MTNMWHLNEETMNFCLLNYTELTNKLTLFSISHHNSQCQALLLEPVLYPYQSEPSPISPFQFPVLCPIIYVQI